MSEALLIDMGLSPEAQALAQGMLLGDKSALDPALTQTLRTAGMSHIMAVSGLHVGILMSVIWLFTAPLQWAALLLLPVRLRVYYMLGTVRRVFVLAAVAWYVWSIGAPVSAVRAWVMLAIPLVGWMVHRPSITWRGWAFAALCLLAWDPWSAATPGFQLSFLAMAGILAFRPWLQDHSRPRAVRLLLLSVAAQWFTTPVVAYWFHQVPVLGWVQGLLVVPMLPVLMTLLLLVLAVPMTTCLTPVIEVLTSWIIWVAQQVEWCERLLLGGHLYLYPTWWQVLLAQLFLLAVLVLLRLRTAPPPLGE